MTYSSCLLPSQADAYRACDKTYGSYAGEACGGPIAGVLFHVLWQLLGTYVLMQLFTGVIIENFVEVTKGSTSMLDRELVSWPQKSIHDQKLDYACQCFSTSFPWRGAIEMHVNERLLSLFECCS